MALTGGTLQAWATVSNVSLQNIGFLTLIGSAYTLKFLWAPLVDRYAPPVLGRRRSWMFFTQILLACRYCGHGLSFAFDESCPCLPLWRFLWRFCPRRRTLLLMLTALMCCASMSARQARPIKVLGYRLAMIVSGGLALVLADQWLGWSNMYLLMGVIMGMCAIATLLAPEPDVVARPPRSLAIAVVEPLLEFFKRPGAITILLLIVLYKLGDAFAGALSTTFLLRGVGFSVSEVGTVNKVFGLVATIVGALAGGSLMARLGLYRSLMLFGVLQAISNFGYWVLAVTPHHLYSMTIVVAVENLCGGLGTAAFVALLMALCKQEFSATQFALLSALSAVGRTYLAGPLTPPLVLHLGWPTFFVITVFIGLPGLILLRMRRSEIQSTGSHELGYADNFRCAACLFCR